MALYDGYFYPLIGHFIAMNFLDDELLDKHFTASDKMQRFEYGAG